MKRFPRAAVVCLLAAIAGLAGGCATTRKAYYDTWEKFGYAKRERLVDNVKAARQEQVTAKQQFSTALEQFKSVVNFNGGDLEKLYNKLDKEYQRSDAEAARVKSKIQSVKNVATALFGEWEDEIGQMSDASLKQKSRALLDRTRGSYQEMIHRMDSASATMDPVLTKFKDHVLFIKHNLNAQAIASLKGTEIEIGTDVDKLIREMEASIAEADSFIAEVQGKQK